MTHLVLDQLLFVHLLLLNFVQFVGCPFSLLGHPGASTLDPLPLHCFILCFTFEPEQLFVLTLVVHVLAPLGEGVVAYSEPYLVDDFVIEFLLLVGEVV